MAVATLVHRGRLFQTRVRARRSLARGLELANGFPVYHGGTAAVPVPGLARNIHVKIASTRAEWEEAFELVANQYQARGYEPAGMSDLRFTSYHALPETVVLVAKAEGHVVATFSQVADNLLLGLPLESVYRTEIKQLRQGGRRIFETTCLADRDLSMREFTHVFLALIQMAWQYGIAQGADTTVMTVNPRHRDFYTKVLGYVPLGPRRSYATVQGHPAEAYFLDAELMRLKAPRVYQRIFGATLPADALRTPQMPRQLARYFAGRSTLTCPAIVEEILGYVQDCGSPRRW
jgi:hypothetical protein